MSEPTAMNRKLVWVVTRHADDGQDARVLSVFSSSEQAQKFVQFYMSNFRCVDTVSVCPTALHDDAHDAMVYVRAPV